MSNVYLIGFMGAGKSTVGSMVAAHLDLPFIDMDREIESVAGHSVSEIFESQGEDEFRRLESLTLDRIASGPTVVVACGGGVVVRDENRVLLKESGCVAYLKVSAAESLARIGDTATRPLLSGSAGAMTATAILAARETLYRAVADITIDTECLDAHAVAIQVSDALGKCT